MLTKLINTYDQLFTSGDVTNKSVRDLVKGYRFLYTNDAGGSADLDIITVKMFHCMAKYEGEWKRMPSSCKSTLDVLECFARSHTLNRIIDMLDSKGTYVYNNVFHVMKQLPDVCNIITSYIYPITVLKKYIEIGNRPTFRTRIRERAYMSIVEVSNRLKLPEDID